MIVPIGPLLIILVHLSWSSITDLKLYGRSQGEAIVLEILKGYQAFTQVRMTSKKQKFEFYVNQKDSADCFSVQIRFRGPLMYDGVASSFSSFFLQACGILQSVEPLNAFLASLCKFTINVPNEFERKRFETFFSTYYCSLSIGKIMSYEYEP